MLDPKVDLKGATRRNWPARCCTTRYAPATGGVAEYGSMPVPDFQSLMLRVLIVRSNGTALEALYR